MAKEYKAALKVAVMPTIDCLPLYVARDSGLYKEQGADIRLKLFTAQMDCDTAIVGGSVDGMVSDLVRTERLKRREGLQLSYVSSTNAEWQLISNRKARIKQTSQLGDKMVAMTRHSATDKLTAMALDGVKTKSQVFRVQVNDVFVRLDMLTGNGVDAAWLPEPMATQARLRGGQVLTDNGKLGFAPGVIAFRSEVMKGKQRERQVKAFVTTYNRACDSINKHGVQHYADILAKYCKADAQSVASIGKIKFRHITPPNPQQIEKAAR